MDKTQACTKTNTTTNSSKPCTTTTSTTSTTTNTNQHNQQFKTLHQQPQTEQGHKRSREQGNQEFLKMLKEECGFPDTVDFSDRYKEAIESSRMEILTRTYLALWLSTKGYNSNLENTSSLRDMI
ncbi:protein of unknown function, DUF4106 family [Trichomonas vaginalis G3]|uniref:protein of unknown function, DUF4106 family n=1 Tax=Trichomonas vaginalis (strain ATCC PRA-98 / G3) TaxID=412133 RepID=UPI0021E57FD1|nr:protein of unknown function, DUF4106 family [Trichomonas vaginalis G3]KAI5502265.1 protein of unknown function, DUF4106 family [Trichomonas vaginalis G3]